MPFLRIYFKKCLDCTLESPDYITCLTTLGHIALLFPGVYNRQLKNLINQQLLAKVLTRDKAIVKESGKNKKGSRRRLKAAVQELVGKPSDWMEDGNLPLLTRTKVSSPNFRLCESVLCRVLQFR